MPGFVLSVGYRRDGDGYTAFAEGGCAHWYGRVQGFAIRHCRALWKRDINMPKIMGPIPKDNQHNQDDHGHGLGLFVRAIRIMKAKSSVNA